MIGENNVSGRVENNFKEIASALGVKRTDMEYGGVDSRVLTTSSPLTTIYVFDELKLIATNPPTIAPISFVVKSYIARPSNLPKTFLDDVSPQLDYQQYGLCSESFLPNDRKFIPAAFMLSTLPDLLVIEKAGDETLETFFEREPGKIKDTLKRLVSTNLPIFHLRVHRFHNDLLQEKKPEYSRVANRLHKDYSPLEDFLELIDVTYSENKDKLKERATEAYAPFVRIYGREHASICFGDFTTTNCMIDGEGNISLIDPRLYLRRQILDVSNLATSPGLNLKPEFIDELVKTYEEGREEQAGYIVKGVGIGKKISLGPELFKSQRTIAQLGVAHEAMRKLLKNLIMKNNCKKRYNDWRRDRKSFRNANEQMRKIIYGTLEYILKYSDGFDISKEEITGLEDLTNIFFKDKSGLLVPSWIYDENGCSNPVANPTNLSCAPINV